MAKKNSLSVLFIFTLFPIFAQSDFKKDFAFIQHLERLEEWEEALLFLNGYDSKNLNLSQIDTINYFKGKFYYKTKQIKLSIDHLNQVTDNNKSFYTGAKFFQAFQQAYNQQQDIGFNTISTFQTDDSLMNQLKNLEMSGMKLLSRDLDAYEIYKNRYQGHYQLALYESGILKQYEAIQSFKPKSAFAAGLFSSVIPGAGRIYIGKAGEGIASILVTGVFALQAWEGYRKDGPESFRFIFFGSLFSVAYVANIWGTVLAVRIRRNEFNAQINDSILLDMHIPLRVLFD